MGVTVGEDDDSPVVSTLKVVRSKLSSDGEITAEVSCRIAKASKVFGCLRIPISLNRTLSIDTKRTVYKAVVISVSLYGAETWTLKAPDVRRLATFHNCSVHTILGASKFYQWQNITISKQLSEQFGLYWSTADFILNQRL